MSVALIVVGQILRLLVRLFLVVLVGFGLLVVLLHLGVVVYLRHRGC